MNSKTILWRLVSLMIVFGIVLTACSTPPAAEPEVVIQTVVVPGEAEKIIETVVVPGEEKVVEVTPTAQPGAITYNPDVSGDLELWHFWASPVRRNAIRRVIAMCQAELPNITVTDTVKPFGDIWTANIAAVAAGSGMPDVIVADRPTLPRDAADGIYMSLQEFADRDGVTRDQFYDWAWDQGVYEGEIYGIPHETDVTVLFYNKQLFAQAGLDPEKPPTTWDEVKEYADALDVKNPDGTYSRIGFFPLWNRGVDVWQYTNGIDMIAEDGTPQINDPKVLEVVEWVKSWVDRYGGWDAVQAFNAEHNVAPPNDNFMSGAVAMRADIFGYNSQLEFYRPNIALDDGTNPRMEWGVALLPGHPDTGTWSGGFALSIPNGSPNAEAAWEFIKCATSAEGQASWARDTQAQPTNIAAAADPVLNSHPLWPVVQEALSTSTGGVYVSKYPNWNEQLNQRWDLIWSNQLTPQEALDEAQAAVEAQIGQ